MKTNWESQTMKAIHIELYAAILPLENRVIERLSYSNKKDERLEITDTLPFVIQKEPEEDERLAENFEGEL